MRFFCLRCWQDFHQDLPRCPHCGLDIRELWKSKDYVEKLIQALQHPEKETPIRAARLLGQLQDPRAVPPLIDLAKSTGDVYIAQAAVTALGEFDPPRARMLRSKPPRSRPAGGIAGQYRRHTEYRLGITGQI